MFVRPHTMPKSGNARLEQLFTAAPGYLNREYVLPCVVKPRYLNRAIENTRHQRRIEEHIGMIVTPNTFARLDGTQRAKVRIMATPLECGRVLEDDQTITIEHRPYVVTFKGCGATTFVRELAEQVYKLCGFALPFNLRPREQLQRLPFAGMSGILDLKAALAELASSRQLHMRHIATEYVLAIYEIEAMPDDHGDLRPIRYFKDAQLIAGDVTPAILVRASQTNLRLLEPYTLHKLGMDAALPAVMDHAVELHRSETHQDSNPSAYWRWLMKRAIAQQMRLTLEGFEITSGFWNVLARNTTLSGEEYDTEGEKINPAAFLSRDGYLSHAAHHLSLLLETLGHVQSSMRITMNRDDFREIAERGVSEAVKDTVSEGIYTMLPSGGAQSCRAFQESLIRALKALIL